MIVFYILLSVNVLPGNPLERLYDSCTYHAISDFKVRFPGDYDFLPCSPLKKQ